MNDASEQHFRPATNRIKLLCVHPPPIWISLRNWAC